MMLEQKGMIMLEKQREEEELYLLRQAIKDYYLHHKIEAIFKAFGKAIKMAVKRDVEKMILPTTKGVL